MIRPLTEAQITENLSSCYRTMFTETRHQKIYAGERVIYAADFTGNTSHFSSFDWGFIVFTDRRYLKVAKLGDMSGVSYYQTGTAWDKLIGRKVENRRWFDPNQSYKKSFLAKLKLTNFDVSDFLYSTIKGIIKNAYSVSYGSKQVELVELHLEFNDRYGEIFKTFKAIDGNYIYDLLNHGLKNDGKLSLDPTQPLKRDSNAEVIRMIKALAELRDAGILTNSEYEIKKSQLLDRL